MKLYKDYPSVNFVDSSPDKGSHESAQSDLHQYELKIG